MSYQHQKSNTAIVLFMLVLFFCGLLAQYVRDQHANGQVLNIYCWDETFPALLAEHYPAYDPETQRIGTVQVHWFIAPDASNVYQIELDKALSQQGETDSQTQVDLFLAEADFVRKYTGNPEYTLSLAELGINEEELSEHFPYTLQAARDSEGTLRGISWQCTPGVMLYRRDMATQILGTDDPAAVQLAVRDWQHFDEMADRVQAIGGTMLSSFNDTYRVFSNGRSSGWLTGDEIMLAPALEKWVEQTLRYTDQHKLLPNEMWTPNWCDAVRGSTFCYFGPAWFIDDAFMLLSLETPVAQGGKPEKGNGTYGLWGVCRGPQPFFWGGTWLCAARGTDNQELIADIMRTLCCNRDTLLAMTSGRKLHFVNNRAVMEERARDRHVGIPFLAGQNPYLIMLKVANEMPDPTQQMTPYDQALNEAFQKSCLPYFQRQASWTLTWQRFLATVWNKHPDLQDASVMY